MSYTLLLKQLMIHTGTGTSIKGDLFIENGKIIEISSSITREADQVIDASRHNWMVVPGFIDLHIHGAAGHDTMDATPDALRGIARALPKEGTTGFLATTMTQSPAAISDALSNADAFERENGEAELLGIHLEGPFLSPKRAGAQPVEFILSPSIEQFDQWMEESGEKIRLITMAPEQENGLTFVNHLRNKGVAVSIGHSDATFEQAIEAVEAGALQVTHLYNQMSPFHHREPGVVGAAFLEDKLSVEIIVDFVHSHKHAVKLAYQQKGSQSVILITDAMRAKGLPAGLYDLGGQQVIVSEKDARLQDGTLAGSILTMEEAVKNIAALTNCSMQELIAMSSANAAKQIGVYDRKGSIEVNKDADLVIMDEDLSIQLTLCRGEIAYKKEVHK
ncbi:N-acetylglucosamine-6-phosphate deacetylase [Jeotgalibacillus sp. ET6]|uniref:N-acetylglucosamine-6-phosphate deacetylase n=1 Tax=Jeotgalibacillus sp. ET6 TaxID=3037260 RepID=UPI0024189F54|nr:N-acetylglucosamine-6-phosphate deacetylase [Jeotgalibacillus sp. ET6]MDG5473946.1 N-acetylglucosamine-6-phosphate deacetylase [Jeotgalibacillus sp. ET6]